MSVAPSNDEDPRIALGSSPISIDHPAGEDARASVEFDRVDSEIRKLDSEGPSAVDWRLVVDQGLDIIGSRSKDILVGAWVSYALFRRESVGGLAVGLSILLGIVRDHWDQALPSARRERARTAPFDWLVGRIAPAIAEASFTDDDAAAFLRVQSALNDIDDVMTARLTKESLNLGELLRAVRPHAEAGKRLREEADRRREEEIRRAEAEAEALSRAPAEATPSASPRPASPATQSSGAAVAGSRADLESLPDALWSLARDLHARDLDDPRSYVLGRVGSWLRLDGLPPAQGGATVLPAPGDLETLESDASMAPEEALKLAEGLVWDSPFALDAHRYSHELLGKIAGDHAAARAAIEGQLAGFLRRFPEARRLTFNDGRPLAGEETLALAEISTAASAPTDAMDEALGKAAVMMRDSRAFDAHELLAGTLRGATSERQRTYWQTAQARFCLEHGYTAAALPLLDHLDRVVEARDLEAWEPDLACAVAELRLRALVQPGSVLPDENHRATFDVARSRLARLDMAAAIRLLVG